MRTAANLEKIFCTTIAGAILAIWVLFTAQCVFAQSADAVRVIKIAAQDQRAVIRIAQGALQVIQVGDDLPGIGRVTEIAPDRVVLEEPGDTGNETVIIRVENGRQNIERIRKGGQAATVLQTPQSTSSND